MTNILISVPSDTRRGGLEEVSYQLARYLSSNLDVIVYVLFLNKKNNHEWSDLEERTNIRFVFGNSNRLRTSIGSFVKNIWTLKHIKFDYVFSSSIMLLGLLGLFRSIGIINSKKFIGRESTDVFKRFSNIKLLGIRLIHVIGYRKLDLLICQTEEMRQSFILHSNIVNSSKVIVIPNPINLSDIIIEDRVNLHPASQFEYIVAAGRLHPIKGYNYLIEAFSLLKIEMNIKYKLIILGEGSMRHELENLIIKLGLIDDVFLIGNVTNVYSYFKYSKLCVVSSILEGFPNVLLQMMSQNNIVVSTKCTGGLELIKGLFLCEPQSSEALANSFIEALNNEGSPVLNNFSSILKERSLDAFIEKIKMNL